MRGAAADVSAAAPPPTLSRRGAGRRLIPALLVLGLAGCAVPGDRAQVIGRSDRFLVVTADTGATSRGLAERYLGDADRYWMIEDANGTRDFRPGQAVVIPLQPWNCSGAGATEHQTVPILAYHRIGGRPSAMAVTVDMFRKQMRYLQEHHYRVIPLSDLAQFLDGRTQLPQRAVVITFDDGHPSHFSSAFPILKEFGYPVTLFLCTDYIGEGGLTESQLREMEESGIFTILPHSKAHSNLAIRLPDESETEYRRRLQREIVDPRRRLRPIVSGPIFGFAYPYGDTNPEVIEILRTEGYTIGATVQSGGNPAFAPPMLLRRNMIYGTGDMERFVSSLEVLRPSPAE